MPDPHAPLPSPEDDDIVDLLEVIKPGKPRFVPVALQQEDSGLDSGLDSDTKAAITPFPDPAPVDHVVDPDEELAVPGLDDLDSLMQSLGGGTSTQGGKPTAPVFADPIDALPAVQGKKNPPEDTGSDKDDELLAELLGTPTAQNMPEATPAPEAGSAKADDLLAELLGTVAPQAMEAPIPPTAPVSEDVPIDLDGLPDFSVTQEAEPPAHDLSPEFSAPSPAPTDVNEIADPANDLLAELLGTPASQVVPEATPAPEAASAKADDLLAELLGTSAPQAVEAQIPHLDPVSEDVPIDLDGLPDFSATQEAEPQAHGPLLEPIPATPEAQVSQGAKTLAKARVHISITPQKDAVVVGVPLDFAEQSPAEQSPAMPSPELAACPGPAVLEEADLNELDALLDDMLAKAPPAGALIQEQQKMVEAVSIAAGVGGETIGADQVFVRIEALESAMAEKDTLLLASQEALDGIQRDIIALHTAVETLQISAQAQHDAGPAASTAGQNEAVLALQTQFAGFEGQIQAMQHDLASLTASVQGVQTQMVDLAGSLESMVAAAAAKVIREELAALLQAEQ